MIATKSNADEHGVNSGHVDSRHVDLKHVDLKHVDLSHVNQGHDAWPATSLQSRPGTKGESFAEIIGHSASTERLLSQLRSTALHLRVAIVEGESGTGKSLVAQQLRRHGPSRSGRLIAAKTSDFNQSTNRADSTREWAALCDRARDGMLVIDDIEQLSSLGQETVLEYLRAEDAGRSSHSSFNRPFHPYRSAEGTLRDGSSSAKTRPGAMQLIVTSSRSLRSLVGAAGFSRELAYRLTAMRFVLQPLRARREDIPALIQHFIEKYAAKHGKVIRGADPEALTGLVSRDWPGNVSELESVIEVACLRVDGQWVRPTHLLSIADALPLIPDACDRSRYSSENASPHESVEDLTLDAAVHRHIADILTRTSGNKLRAARMLGISRSTLYRMLQGEETA